MDNKQKLSGIFDSYEILKRLRCLFAIRGILTSMLNLLAKPLDFFKKNL